MQERRPLIRLLLPSLALLPLLVVVYAVRLHLEQPQVRAIGVTVARPEQKLSAFLNRPGERYVVIRLLDKGRIRVDRTTLHSRTTGWDFSQLSDHLYQLKRQQPRVDKAFIFTTREIEHATLVELLDTVRVTSVEVDGRDHYYSLFPRMILVGSAS